MSLRIKATNNFRLPNLLLIKELEEIARREIVPDILKKMDREVSIENESYGALSPSTLKAKARKGYNLKTLHATGKLRRSITSAKISETSVAIFLEGSRPDGQTNSELGDILQNQGIKTKSGKRYFEFFGISEEAQIRAYNFMKKIIEERIKRA